MHWALIVLLTLVGLGVAGFLTWWFTGPSKSRQSEGPSRDLEPDPPAVQPSLPFTFRSNDGDYVDIAESGRLVVVSEGPGAVFYFNPETGGLQGLDGTYVEIDWQLDEERVFLTAASVLGQTWVIDGSLARRGDQFLGVLEDVDGPYVTLLPDRVNPAVKIRQASLKPVLQAPRTFKFKTVDEDLEVQVNKDRRLVLAKGKPAEFRYDTKTGFIRAPNGQVLRQSKASGGLYAGLPGDPIQWVYQTDGSFIPLGQEIRWLGYRDEYVILGPVFGEPPTRQGRLLVVAT